ncbi:hypothetical protein DTI93_09210 [Parasaccharibacter sp. TMW 2.1884]|nr:hypothetical protein [Parasaccharibacter sp. TMW 2.1884]
MSNSIRQAIKDAPEAGEAGPCPVAALGHAEGRFYFLDAVGQLRDLSASQVGKREDLMSLFLDEGMWLTAPKWRSLSPWISTKIRRRHG